MICGAALQEKLLRGQCTHIKLLFFARYVDLISSITAPEPDSALRWGRRLQKAPARIHYRHLCAKALVRPLDSVWRRHTPFDSQIGSAAPDRSSDCNSISGGGRTLVLTDSLSKFKADSISKNGLFIYS
eukprot:sb/3475270/